MFTRTNTTEGWIGEASGQQTSELIVRNSYSVGTNGAATKRRLTWHIMHSSFACSVTPHHDRVVFRFSTFVFFSSNALLLIGFRFERCGSSLRCDGVAMPKKSKIQFHLEVALWFPICGCDFSIQVFAATESAAWTLAYANLPTCCLPSSNGIMSFFTRWYDLLRLLVEHVCVCAEQTATLVWVRARLMRAPKEARPRVPLSGSF